VSNQVSHPYWTRGVNIILYIFIFLVKKLEDKRWRMFTIFRSKEAG
jgi:hypothetical protein